MSNKQNDNLPKRKTTRLSNYDYSKPGAYFITICTKDRQCILSDIVGTDVPDGPKILLTKYGEIAEKYIREMNDFYTNISVDKYVIMPNHIHFLIQIHPTENAATNTLNTEPSRTSDIGPSRTPDIGPSRTPDIGPSRTPDIGPSRAV